MIDPTTTKRCADCHHLTGDRCELAQAPDFDYVNGRQLKRLAQYEREDERDGHCGPTARHFKPKAPF
jgi:hypothetical protein